MKNIINKDEENTSVVLFLDGEPVIMDIDNDGDIDDYNESVADISKIGVCFAGGFIGAIAIGAALADGINIDKTDALIGGASAILGFKLIKTGYKALNMSRNKRNKSKELKLIKE